MRAQREEGGTWGCRALTGSEASPGDSRECRSLGTPSPPPRTTEKGAGTAATSSSQDRILNGDSLLPCPSQPPVSHVSMAVLGPSYLAAHALGLTGATDVLRLWGTLQARPPRWPEPPSCRPRSHQPFPRRSQGTWRPPARCLPHVYTGPGRSSKRPVPKPDPGVPPPPHQRAHTRPATQPAAVESRRWPISRSPHLHIGDT